jgi:quercetin dioxygenase-like cupin family protein
MGAALVRQADDGERRWFYGGGLHLWKATAEDTGGACFLFEDFLEKGKTTPYHAHEGATEVAYLLEGEIRFVADGVEHLVRAGGCTITPPGTPHAFVVVSDTARLLAMQVPGHGDAFYRGASDPATAELEAAAPVDFDRVIEVGTSSGGMVVLGPPPFAR